MSTATAPIICLIKTLLKVKFSNESVILGPAFRKRATVLVASGEMTSNQLTRATVRVFSYRPLLPRLPTFIRHKPTEAKQVNLLKKIQH